METCAEIQPQLSEFADGALTSEAQAAVGAHLRGCADCSGVLADLERLIATARQFGPVAPPDHVWLEVAGQMRIGSPGAVPVLRRAAVRGPAFQWIGIAATLLIVTAVVSIMSRGRLTAPGSTPAIDAVSTPAPPAATGSIDAVATELDQAQQHYERAISELMAAAASPDSAVDPAVATTVQQNLGAIDRAIVESRAALTANPQSDAARDSLFDALRRKITVLQATVSLINQMRQGDQEGAARTAAGLGKKS